MKTIFLTKLTVALLFLIAFSGSAIAQRDRVGADASRSIRSRDDRPEPRPSTKQSADVTASQLGRLSRIRANLLAIAGTGSICDKYQSEFLPMLENQSFAETHVDRGPEELALAYFLVADNEKIRDAYKTGMALYIERTQVVPRDRSYVQILVEKRILDRALAKEAVKVAEQKLSGP